MGERGTPQAASGHRHTHMAPDPTRSASDFWEEHYSGVDRVWSGNVNTALREVAGDLPPGRALDLGSAEGADSIWLAQRGWTVTGVEVSPTAVERATAAVQQAGIEPGRVEFVVADLEDYEFDGPYDLIVAAFLQSPLNFKRERVLAAAARAVAAGGRIIIIAHASIPPWAAEEHRGDVGLTRPDQELENLELTGDAWEIEVCGIRTREATGSNGEKAELDDSVVVAKRLGA